MKTLRILLLVVLSVLLPVRGAMAIAMSCPAVGATSGAVGATFEAVGATSAAVGGGDALDGQADAGPGDTVDHSRHHVAPVGDGSNGSADAAASPATAGAQAPASADEACTDDTMSEPGHADHASHQCTHCGDLCAMTPMPSVHSAALPEPLVGEVVFVGLDAPSPSFAAGGQDRPPRSC